MQSSVHFLHLPNDGDLDRLCQDNPAHLRRSIAQQATIFHLGPQSVVETDAVLSLGYSQRFNSIFKGGIEALMRQGLRAHASQSDFERNHVFEKLDL